MKVIGVMDHHVLDTAALLVSDVPVSNKEINT